MPRTRPVALSLFVCSVLLTTFCFAAPPDRISGAIDTSRTVVLAKSQHPLAQPQYDRGPVDPAFKLGDLTLVIAPSASQQKALDRLLAQQQDPNSPNYHQWLTPQQYADRFGLSQNDLTRIAHWLQSEGFQIVSVGGGRNSIVFAGTAAEVQRAFGTEIHNYEVDGVQHYANAAPVMLPAALKGIVTGVIGLHNILPRPAHGGNRFDGVNIRPQYYDGSFVFPNFLAPGDVATIYDINALYNSSPAIDGTGQKLAVLGQTDIYLADINNFRSGFGLSTIPSSCSTNGSGIVTSPCTTTNFAYVFVGVSSFPTDPGVDYGCGDLGEADLDIEWTGAVARNAQIIFVNTPAHYDINCNVVTGSGNIYNSLIAAVNPPPPGPPIAPVISMSYGFCEIGAPNLETYLQQGNAEGVTILNSSGDVGSTACDYSPPSVRPFGGAVNGLAVSYPASSPEVTGVGGTAISLANDSYPTPSPYWGTTNGPYGDTAKSYIPELSWNDDEELASYCQAAFSTSTFCKQGSKTPVTGWVALGASATAQQVQEDIWILQGGGGASNCWYLNSSNICLGPGPGPSGGGFAQPTYQQGLSVAGAPAGVRYVPDVSLLASPVFPGYIFCTSSSCASGIPTAVANASFVGGTSVSTPVFAGIVTLLNQYVVAKGIQSTPGLGNINPRLYQLAANNSTNKVFNRATGGDNNVYCQAGQPSGFPSNVVCPTAGVFGFSVSNSDATTGYNLVTGLGSVDANNLLTAWAAAGATTATALISSPNPQAFGSPVTFTATVTTTGTHVPTGSVTFYNGSTAIGPPASLNGGSPDQATLTISSLPSGSDSIAATYGGDTNNAKSTSVVLMQTITAPDFSLANTGASTSTVNAGVATGAVYSFTVTPKGASTFAANVTFACSFSPTDPTLTTSSCIFSPASIAAGTNGVGGVPVTVSVATVGPNTAAPVHQQRRADNRVPWLPLAFPLAGIVAVGFAGRKLSRYSLAVSLCLALVLAGLLIACGGNSTPPISVSPVSASPAAVYPNNSADSWPAQTSNLSVTVTNDSANKGVTWTATKGTVASTGPTTATYTAPTIVAGLPASDTITATSVADSTKSNTGSVTLKPATVPGTYTITVTVSEDVTSHPVPAPTLQVVVK